MLRLHLLLQPACARPVHALAHITTPCARALAIVTCERALEQAVCARACARPCEHAGVRARSTSGREHARRHPGLLRLQPPLSPPTSAAPQSSLPSPHALKYASKIVQTRHGLEFAASASNPRDRTDFHPYFAAGEGTALEFLPKQLSPSLSSCRWCFHRLRSLFFSFLFFYAGARPGRSAHHQQRHSPP